MVDGVDGVGRGVVMHSTLCRHVCVCVCVCVCVVPHTVCSAAAAAAAPPRPRGVNFSLAAGVTNAANGAKNAVVKVLKCFRSSVELIWAPLPVPAHADVSVKNTNTRALGRVEGLYDVHRDSVRALNKLRGPVAWARPPPLPLLVEVVDLVLLTRCMRWGVSVGVGAPGVGGMVVERLLLENERCGCAPTESTLVHCGSAFFCVWRWF